MSLRSTGNREEVNAGLIRQGREEEAPTKFMQSLERFARHERDVATGDAQIVEFTVRQAAQLTHGLAVAAPIAVVADQVHLRARFLLFVLFRFFLFS